MDTSVSFVAKRSRPRASEVVRNPRHGDWLYHTPRWRHIRDQILSDEVLCRLCMSPANTVDHLSGETSDNTRSNLQALCQSCHSWKTNEYECRVPLRLLFSDPASFAVEVLRISTPKGFRLTVRPDHVSTIAGQFDGQAVRLHAWVMGLHDFPYPTLYDMYYSHLRINYHVSKRWNG